MKTVLASFLLLAPLAFAASDARQPFPDDYVRQSCAPVETCSSVQPHEFSQLASLRGYNLPQEWVLQHWDEMLELMRPTCEKVANCQAMPGNHWVWCKDILQNDFAATCTKFEDETDRRRCHAFSAVFFVTHDRLARLAHEDVQECAIEERDAEAERLFDYWISPSSFEPGRAGTLTVHVADRETRIPLMAQITIDRDRFEPTDTVSGEIVSGYAQRYTAGFRRVPRADGYRDLVPPVITISAAGYRTEQLVLPVVKPSMVVEMQPKTLQRGRNTITIVARDATTGAPVDLRVMANDRVLGKSNRPLEIEWPEGEASPEIWVTSLYDRYDDVVLWKKTK